MGEIPDKWAGVVLSVSSRLPPNNKEKDMLRYIGKGFLPGIPARNLSKAEVKKYGGVTYLVSTGLFIEPVKEKKVKAKIEPIIEEGEEWQDQEHLESFS
jgi:hypothetical protein